MASSSLSAPPSSSSVGDWDLTSSLSPFLDLHMLFPLLEYVDSVIIKSHGTYDSSAVAASRLDLARQTNMVDYAMDIYKGLHKAEAVPAEMEEQRKKVLETRRALTAGAQKLVDLTEDAARCKTLVEEGRWNLAGLAALDIPEDIVENYRSLAKFNYECGDYAAARPMLDVYLSLFVESPQASSLSPFSPLPDAAQLGGGGAASAPQPPCYGLPQPLKPALHAALWGKLACSILVERWDEATEALAAVKLAVEQRAQTPVASGGLAPLEALQQRTWLLHWGLFVFWNAKKGLDAIVDLYMSEKYMQAIQTNAPHLVRYLATAVIINKRKRLSYPKDGKSGLQHGEYTDPVVRSLVKVIQHCEYADPIIQFVDCLYVKFDFEGAQEKLKACELVLSTDFFLCKQAQLFMEEARVMIFESYCRIHQKIDITTLGSKLAMAPADAERWIVDLIRNALLDAKIDSTQNCVVMGNVSQNVYQQVIHKTKDLTARSGALGSALAQISTDIKKDIEKKNRRDSRDDD